MLMTAAPLSSRSKIGAATTVVGIGIATVVAGVTFLVLADDGPGSGNGVVGSSAAVTLGLVAIPLGTLARARRRPVT